ncbi:MAG: phenylalanine--tRNA ligase subunit beta [Gammaproteobacteria bacterium]|nr:phenylalanine--tRNA ligase subunit beta [Gammaproteobacteria bacterium]
MKFSERWLREWVDPPVAADELAEQLTMAGLEVDSVAALASGSEGVIVARVLAVEPHPAADRLQICVVDDGSGTDRTVVCGAPNVRPGIGVALACPGSLLPGGRRVDRARLRGVESAGMLCSEFELGLGEDASGLLVLPADVSPGESLAGYLGLPDHVFDVDLTPNRGDCLSVAGIAREVAVRNRMSVSAPAIASIPAQIDAAFPVRIEDPESCPVYAGRVIRDVDTGAPSPVWLRERLRRSGVRSLSAIVDVTNYVMLELGQPLHAFDLNTLADGIVVRRARDGETLTLLDGRNVTPGPETLVIADHVRAVALAGIMGGLETGVGAVTTDIFLEGAYFAPAAIAPRARALHLHTDASQRFERGVSPDLQAQAIERATALILAICGGVPGPTTAVRAAEHLPQRAAIGLRRARMRRLLGYEVADAVTERCLLGLGMEVAAAADGWRVTPPAFRFDIALEADLIEEVARSAGYADMPEHAPRGALVVRGAAETRVPARRLGTVLVERGYQEVVTYSFVDPTVLAAFAPGQRALALANPISADLSVMRTGLWPGLVQVLQRNLRRQRSRVRVFEIGPAFLPQAAGVSERSLLAAAVYGDVLPEQWGSTTQAVDFFDLKADVEAILGTVGGLGACSFTPLADDPALHPGQAAAVLLDGRPAGRLGALHPRVAGALDLPAGVWLLELDVARIATGRLPQYRALSRFPRIRRDLSVVLDRTVSAAAVLATARHFAGELLVDLQLFDVYQGEGIDSGKKSLAIGLIFQGSSSTLLDEQVDAVVEKIVAGIAAQHGASLRN